MYLSYENIQSRSNGPPCNTLADNLPEICVCIVPVINEESGLALVTMHLSARIT